MRPISVVRTQTYESPVIGTDNIIMAGLSCKRCVTNPVLAHTVEVVIRIEGVYMMIFSHPMRLGDYTPD
ncbi:MAG: hypothetical protein ACXWL9_09435 [Syntrophales bacterium]